MASRGTAEQKKSLRHFYHKKNPLKLLTGPLLTLKRFRINLYSLRYYNAKKMYIGWLTNAFRWILYWAMIGSASATCSMSWLQYAELTRKSFSKLKNSGKMCSLSGRGLLLSHLGWLARFPHVGPGFSSVLLDRSVRRGCFFPVVFRLGVASSGTGRRPGDSLIFDLWPSTDTFWLSLALALSLLGLEEKSVFLWWKNITNDSFNSSCCFYSSIIFPQNRHASWDISL